LSHLDDETIALAAIGETLDGAHADHLADCASCRGEIASLALVVGVARSTATTETLVAPPPAVWAGIAAETGVNPALVPTSLDARRAARAEAPAGADHEPAPRSRRTIFLVAASIVGLLLGVGGTLAWQAADNGGADVLASASLAPLPDKIGNGRAEVVDTSSGRELDLTIDTASPPDAFLQVWLLSPDATKMVPVGVIAGSSGHWPLPAGVTLADYPVVDVSIEPYDGNPLHSTNSVVRGTLDIASALAALGD
jgi:hypothetical protein